MVAKHVHTVDNHGPIDDEAAIGLGMIETRAHQQAAATAPWTAIGGHQRACRQALGVDDSCFRAVSAPRSEPRPRPRVVVQASRRCRRASPSSSMSQPSGMASVVVSDCVSVIGPRRHVGRPRLCGLASACATAP